mgnify:CR=1 FL=1
MRPTRRAVAAGLAALGLSPVARLARADGEPAFVAARREPDGSFAAAVLDGDGRLLFSERLAGRGHDAAIAPGRRLAVLFARRPGRFAVVLDLAGRRSAGAFAPPADRHFYGHGVFTPDGRLLYATENDFDAERGVLGVYDVAAGFRRIGEIDTHGIGPHEAILMADGRTIAVANGGIATHPDAPRMALNRSTMEPSLAYLDAATGDLIDKASLSPSLRQLSIRHIAEAADGSIWFGGQYEGPATDPVDVVGRHRPGDAIGIVAAPDGLSSAMGRYVGSVAASRDGLRIATSAPRGRLVLVWDAETGDLLDRRRMADACGLAPRFGGFLVSDGIGRLWQDRDPLAAHPGIAWDNHLAAIGPG